MVTERGLSLSSFDLGMPVGEALHKGLVQRVFPKFLCGSLSPETSVQCRLEPNHESVHHGHDGPSSFVSWANDARGSES